MEKIKLFGEDITISFNIAVQIHYEKITDKPFDVVDLSKVENSMALYYAVILCNNPTTNISFERLAYELTFEEMKMLTDAVNSAVSEWYGIPKPANIELSDNKEESEKND